MRQFQAISGRPMAVLRQLCVSATLLWVAPPLAQAAEAKPTEYQVKAAYLFNFAKFVEWPTDKFKKRDSPLVIGILGDDRFGESLEVIVRNKTIEKRPLVLRHLNRGTDLSECHLLFISRSEADHFEEVIAGLQGMAILTVSESDQFLDRGGMINFGLEADQVKLEINLEAAEKARLQISSRLLSLQTVKIKKRI